MMENPGQYVEPLPSFIQTIGEMLNTGVESEPQQEPEPESDQETSGPPSGPLQLENLESRRRQLCNRQVLLQRIQQLRKTPGDDSDRSTDEVMTDADASTSVTSEDSDEVGELENIEKELQALQLNKKQLETEMENVTHAADRGRQDEDYIIYKTPPPYGGIYMLPPLPLTQECTIEERSEEATPAEETPIGTTPAEETPTGPIVPVESLAAVQAFTRCPSCDQIVFTETRSIVGDTIWLLCCVGSMLGCVAGCCLIPFCMENLKDIQHWCPLCQAHIHTFRHL